MMLDVHHLEIVRAVHEAGSLSRACRRLHMSQPALTRQLAVIEQRLGTPLFRRHARGMALTAAGARVLETAGRVLADLARAEDDVRRLAVGEAGALRVGTECFMCYHWLPEVAQSVARRHPGIAVELVPEATRDPWGALRQAAVDVALVYSAPPDESRARRVPLFHDEMVGVVAASHPLASLDWLEPAHFAAESLLCHYAEPRHGAVEAGFLAPAGIAPRRTMELLVTPAVLAMARAGHGIAIAPRWLLEPTGTLDGLVALPLGRDGLWRPWFAAHDPARASESALGALLDALRTSLERPDRTTRAPLVRLA